MKKPYEIDVAVLLIFFSRYEVFEKTFFSVREAKPKTLLLWQDGPREGEPTDIAGIMRCREVLENIDWDCILYTNFHDTNIGCDPSTFLAQKWAFTLVDKCIVLEDDMVADKTFFIYSKQLLDKYENDDRINHICGINFLGVWKDCPNDYFFAHNGTGAWASWRRVIQGWDASYSFLTKEYYLKNLKKSRKDLFNFSYKIALDRHGEGKAYWETILGFDCMLNNRLVIIPKVNLVSNIGITPGATHSSSIRLMDQSTAALFYMQVHQQVFPLKHPEYFVVDENYSDEVSKISGIGHPLLRLKRKISYGFKCLILGEYERIYKVLKRNISRRKQ